MHEAVILLHCLHIGFLVQYLEIDLSNPIRICIEVLDLTNWNVHDSNL